MLSLLRTHTEQLKWTSKRKKSMGKAVGKRVRGECPVAGAGAPGSGAPRTLFPTAFTIDFWRFEVHFSCSVGVLRRDSISAHVWYGLRSNLVCVCACVSVMFYFVFTKGAEQYLVSFQGCGQSPMPTQAEQRTEKIQSDPARTQGPKCGHSFEHHTTHFEIRFVAIGRVGIRCSAHLR